MTLAEQLSIRILHVVGGMNRGGTETWLMHILRHIDRERFQMDFLVHTAQLCAYDDEIRALGSKVIPCPLSRSKPWLYARNFKRILRECGPYDIVHSHVHHFSGYVLRLAKQVGVPVCIAHSHLDTSNVDAQAGLLRRGYLNLMQQWIACYATIGMAASQKAAVALFGSTWDADPQRQILYCSVDLTSFQKLVDSVAVRTELGIPPDAFVISHVGRFDAQKNHGFLVEIAAEVAKREPSMRLLLLGHGSLRPNIEQKVAQLGLTDRTIFAGVRHDVPRIMQGAMDVFLFPSLHEGLPLALLEAQAANLPCIFSDNITDEVEVVKPLMRRISLSQPPSTWAEAVLATRETASVNKQPEALNKMIHSPFNIMKGLANLTDVYSLASENAKST
jgi:glycosyltransferase involved in cell wall biosynthesis